MTNMTSLNRATTTTSQQVTWNYSRLPSVNVRAQYTRVTVLFLL